jgi:ATP/maltotriose-dependent transcriptional regulator MalT
MSAKPVHDPWGKYDTFGELLKHLRRRAQLTQRELGIAVGYSEAQISRLEHNRRPPDPTALTALFVPALGLEDQPEAISRLVDLAASARGDPLPDLELTIERVTRHEIVEEVGTLESIPLAPGYEVPRPAVLQHLKQRLERERCVALCGMPGTGKSTLAAGLARAAAVSRPVFWLSLAPGGNLPAGSILHEIALFLYARGNKKASPLLGRAADPAPALSIDQQINLLAGALTGEEALLCFDDVHVLTQESLAMIGRLAAASAGAFLMVSRSEVALPGFAQMVLGGLEREEGRLLIKQLGARLEGPDVKQILERTDGNPMLIRLAVGQLAGRERDPAELLRHLETQPQIAAYLLDTILADLPPVAWGLLDFLSLFRQPVNLYDPALVELFRQEDAAFELGAALKALDGRHLLDDPVHARLHPLVRDHLYARSGGDPDRLRRFHQLAAAWYEGRRGEVLETVYHYCRAGQPGGVADELTDQVETLYNRGEAEAAAELVEQALQLAERDPGDRDLARRLRSIRGDLLVNTTRAGDAEADYRQAFALALETNLAPVPQARLGLKLAQCLLQRGAAGEALELCQSAARALENGEASLLAQLAVIEGRAQLITSDFEAAARLSQKALDLVSGFAWRQPGWADRVRAQAHSTLGIVCHIRRDHENALLHLRQAVDIARSGGMRFIEYRSLSNLAGLLFETGDLENALHSYEQAVEGLSMMGDQFALARVLHNMASILYARGELRSALDQNERACEIKRQVGDLQGLINSESQRVLILLTSGHLQEALNTAERIVGQAEAMPDTRARGVYLDNLALALMLSGDPGSAMDRLEEAGSLSGVNEDGRLTGYIQNHVALVHIGLGDPAAAGAMLASDPPAGAGPEVHFERDLVRAMQSLAVGEQQAALDLVAGLEERATRSGYLLYAGMARRFKQACANQTPINELPARVMTVAE